MSHQGLYEMGMLLVALPLLLFERALSKGKLKSQWEACALKTHSLRSLILLALSEKPGHLSETYSQRFLCEASVSLSLSIVMEHF